MIDRYTVIDLAVMPCCGGNCPASIKLRLDEMISREGEGTCKSKQDEKGEGGAWSKEGEGRETKRKRGQAAMTLAEESGGLQAQEDMQRVLWSPSVIHQRVAELGASISRDFAHSQPLVVIGVATGAFMFVADLVRKISLPINVEFVRIQSYGNKTESSGLALISDELKMDINGKHVLVVEDIIDTGTTIARLVLYLSEKGAASVSVCAFLDKIAHRKLPLRLSTGSRFYRGFECPDDFVVGYGMDFAEQYRNLPYIGVLKPSKYNLISDQ